MDSRVSSVVLACALLLAGCGISQEPTRALAHYAEHKAEFNALVAEIDACRPQAMVEGYPETYTRPEKDSTKMSCTRGPHREDPVKPMMRKLKVRGMNYFEEGGVLRVHLLLEAHGLGVSGSQRSLVFKSDGRPLEIELKDGEAIPADPADTRWSVLDEWT